MNHRFGEDGGDGVGKTLQAIDDGQHDILDTAVAQFVHDAQPEFGAFILLQPQAKDHLGAVGHDAQGNMDRLVANHALVADLNPDRIEENQRIGWVQRALLPGRDLLQHSVRDRADQVG